MKKTFQMIFVLLSIFMVAACSNQADGSGIQVEFIDSGDQAISTIFLDEASTIDEPAAPTYHDYEFGGWFEDSRYTKPWEFATKIVDKSIKLYAKWTTTVNQTVSVQTGTNSQGDPVYEKEVTTSAIRVNPRVVVTFALEVADIFKVAGFENTGITYFGLPKSNLPQSINQFASNTYPNTGTLFEPDYDTLDLMMPDLIIIGGRSSSLYSTLKTKYPNIDVLDVSNTTFSFDIQTEVFENLGKVFPGIKESLETHHAAIQTQLAEITAQVDGQNALFLQVNGDQISVFGKGSRYAVVYDAFNFLPSDPDAKTLEAHGNIVSFEYVSEVNPQIIFIMDRSAAVGSSGSVDLIMSNALVKNTTAGKNNDMYILDPMSWYILPGGIESTYQMIEDVSQVFK